MFTMNGKRIVVERRIYHKQVPFSREPVETLCGSPHILIDVTSDDEAVNCPRCRARMKLKKQDLIPLQ